MDIRKKIIVACSIVFSVFIVLLSTNNKYYHSKGINELDNSVTTLANNCKDGQYYISAKGYCASCPTGYNHSDGARNMKSNCYLITEPGKFVPYAESEQESCPYDSYSEGNIKVYYGKNNFCTRCPKNTGSNIGSKSLDACEKTSYNHVDNCPTYSNLTEGDNFKAFCIYDFGKDTKVTASSKNTNILEVTAHNGDATKNAYIEYNAKKAGKVSYSYSLNETTFEKEMFVHCKDNKLLSIDGESCVTSCAAGEIAKDGACEKTVPTIPTCKSDEELIDGKCVKKQEPTKSCKDDEELVNGKCVSKKENPCNSDEKLVDNECVKIENKCYKTCENEYVWGDYENQACYNPVDDITKEEDCHKNEEVKPPVVKDEDNSKKTLIFLIVFVVVIIIAMFISASLSKQQKITISTRKVKKDDEDYNDFSNYYR